MKNIKVKLKPLFLKNEEILVQPPSFLTETSGVNKQLFSTLVTSTIEHLRDVVQSHQLKHEKTEQFNQLTEEKASVEKLSEFKNRRKRNGRSPLPKAMTFRKTFTVMHQDGGKSSNPSPKKIEKKPTLANLMQRILSNEKGRVKSIEFEMQQYSEDNKQYEKTLKHKLKSTQENIEKVSQNIIKSKEESKEIIESKIIAQKEYEENMNNIAFKDKEHTLSMYMINGKKKNHMEVSEEREYFTLKEILRKSKRDLHSSYIENQEKIQENIDRSISNIESLQDIKRNLQNELKEIQENLLAFYCKNLKDGMDLREDGIRWCIKKIWKMNQPVPISSFPKYLDQKSSFFLLNMSNIDLEIVKLEINLSDYREQIKKDMNSSRTSKSPTDLYRTVKNRIRIASQKSRALSTKKIYIKEEENLFSADNSLIRYHDINYLKETIKEKENIKANLSLAEIQRVVENYKIDNNELGLMHVIRCLVGEKLKDFRKYLQLNKPNK